MKRAIGTFVLGCVFTVAGCGSDAPAVGGAENDYYARLAIAYADLVGRCCGQVGLRGVVDVGEMEQFYRRGRPAPESGATFNPAEGERCIAAVMAAGCTLSKDPYPREPDCEFVYEGGNLSVGANCNGAYECASGPENPTACIGRTENGIVVNRCRSVVERAEGASCAQPDDVLVRVACQEPLRCDFRTVTCASRPSFGETCETTDGRGDTCAHGFLCDRAGTGVCITPKPIGDACNDEEECEGNACIHGACREPLVLVSEWNCEP